MDSVSAEAEPVPETSVTPRQVSDLMSEIVATLADLKVLFDSKIRYDEVKERQIDALHRELESHRQGLYQQILRPVLTDLIGVYDEIASQAAGGSPVAADSLLEMIEVALERYGASKYHCDGDHIDRSRQRVIDVELTGDAELTRRLARRLRPGFEVEGKVLRPEWVVGYRYAADSELGG